LTSIRPAQIKPKIEALESCNVLSTHIDEAPLYAERLKSQISRLLQNSSQSVCSALDSGDISQLAEVFDSYKRLAILCKSCKIVDEIDPASASVHRRILQSIEDTNNIFDAGLRDLDFKAAVAAVDRLQRLGFFLISPFSLYYVELQLKQQLKKDSVLAAILTRVHSLFGDTKLTKVGRYYAALGLDRSATERQVRRNDEGTLAFFDLHSPPPTNGRQVCLFCRITFLLSSR